MYDTFQNMKRIILCRVNIHITADQHLVNIDITVEPYLVDLVESCLAVVLVDPDRGSHVFNQAGTMN